MASTSTYRSTGDLYDDRRNSKPDVNDPVFVSQAENTQLNKPYNDQEAVVRQDRTTRGEPKPRDTTQQTTPRRSNRLLSNLFNGSSQPPAYGDKPNTMQYDDQSDQSVSRGGFLGGRGPQNGRSGANRGAGGGLLSNVGLLRGGGTRGSGETRSRGGLLGGGGLLRGGGTQNDGISRSRGGLLGGGGILGGGRERRQQRRDQLPVRQLLREL